MKDLRTARNAGLLVVGAAVGAAGLLAGVGDVVAGPKELSRKRQAATVGRIEVPLGLQGLRGAGGNVVVPFTLVDPSRAKSDVDVQYGIDSNADGVISDDEYVPATEDRLDPRNTRKNRKPQLWVTAGDIGATNAFVWRSTADVQTDRYETLLYRYTDQGRRIPDVNNPGEFLFDEAQAGVRVRLRAVKGSGKKRLVGEWALTDAFSLNNNTPPSLTIDQILPNEFGGASDENVFINWTAFDPDSEDANSDGVFDPGEDTNGNGVFDQEQMGVAFDYYRLQSGEDPASMTDEQLAALTWAPCTRAEGLGDTDSFRETGEKKVYGTAGGRPWTFVWNSIADVGTIRDRFILRAQPVDAKKENGAFVYLRSPFTLDNWKVFSSAAAGNSAISLASSRVGCTVTNLVYGLERSDAAYGKPFQEVVVVGGSATETGAPVTNVELFLVNSETADTVSAEPVPLTLQTARRFHSATLLPDGRVIFAGGFDAAGQPLASTEIYDPATRTLTAGPALRVARARHTAVLLSTNEVAFIGGVGAANSLLASIEVYHPTEFGSDLAGNTDFPSLGAPMHSASAVVLPDQKVLIAGGIGTVDLTGAPVASAFLLDPLAGPVDAGIPGSVKPKTPTVTAIAGPITARKFAGFTALLDGNVLVSGGVSGGAVQGSLEVYNWKTGVFEAVGADMPDGGRAQHTAALLGDGSVLLAGGATTDPSAASPQVTGKADVLRLGANTDGTWDAQFQQVNGDMVVARRNASNDVMMNGRPFIAGGLGATGSSVATCEVYTPDDSRNFAPKVYVTLPTSQLSHAYGATIYYRVVDAEGDRARIQAQFRVPGGKYWNACSAQSDTIGGDVADPTADLTTTTSDVDHDVLAIDPVGKNTPGDHSYIWSMLLDIDRPLPGAENVIAGYNVRVLPFGAVRGAEDVSDPVTVLYNTKAVTYIVPLEDAIGAANPRQGGDINLWVHVRDIDGAGTAPRPGDPCSVRFEFAEDLNGDGQITSSTGENFNPMTPAKFPTGNNTQTNPVTNVTTWSEAPSDPSSQPATRPSAQGWLAFNWDALYDLGPPTSVGNYERRNIWVRVTATDDDEGFPKILRNRSGQPDEFVYIRDLQALYLSSFAPAGGNAAAVKVNEPIVMNFNGNIDPASVGPTTLKIYRSTTQILGSYQVENDFPAPGRSRVTFYPQPQNLNGGSLVYGINDTNTVLFPFNQYRIRIPGYPRASNPATNSPATVRPLGWVAAQSTFQKVNSGVVDGDTDAQYRFTTTSGSYNDGQVVSRTGTSPTSGNTLSGAPAASGFSLTYSHAIDVATVASPNIRVTGNAGQTYVVPGRWTVTNVVNTNGTSSATLSFVPLFKLPSGDAIRVDTATGFRGTNGLTDSTVQPLATYAVNGAAGLPPYVRTTTSQTETFTNTLNEDTTYVPPSPNTLASWGTDACAGGTLSGLQDGATQPNPTTTTDLTVTAGSTLQLTSSAYDYRNITVQKGGRLNLRASVPMVIRANGNITIDGIVDFSGAEGASGSHGQNSTSYSFTLATTSSTASRSGGTGYNGGGRGGNSTHSSSDFQPGTTGTAGSGTTGTGGGGGNKPSTTLINGNTLSTYYYGGGGGAGAGHARSGLAGGHAGATSSFNSSTGGFVYTQQGLPSLPGGTGGTADFSSGITAGSGGGGGCTPAYISGSGTNYYQTSGAGGAGGGAVTFICNGSFLLGPTGYLNGQGGQGGSKSHYGGSGGGGSGGGLWIKSGAASTFDGIIDLRGGRGGPASFAYCYDSYAFGGAFTNGSPRFGGDGGPGRLVVEAPNFLPGLTDDVRVFGALTVRKVATLPTTSLTYVSPPTALSSTGGTGSQSFDAGGLTDVAYTSLNIVAGRTVFLRNGTGTSNKGLRIYVRDTADISGTLKINGSGAPLIDYSSFPYEKGEYAPLTSSEAQAVTQPFRYFYNANTTAYNTGYTGVVGGGDGGKHAGNTASTHPYSWEAYDGSGPGGGKHKIKSGGGGYSGWYTGDSGGAGAGNAMPGRPGWCPYGAPYAYNYSGGVLDTTGNGVAGTTRETDGAQGGAALDASTLTVSSIASFPGSGGGGGNPGGWPSQRYMGIAGTGGAGGGALAIICQGTINLNSGSIVDASGGDGNPPGDAYPYYYSQAAGGGGSGGTFYIAGDRVTVAAVTVGEGSGANGATIDLHGGDGGGWRQPSAGIPNRYPWYNSHGNFGGDGGYGRFVIDYRTSLNSGKALANRWGFEQSVYHDGTNQYRTLAGTATFKCRGRPGGGYFRSKFVDLGSLRPRVTSLAAGTRLNTGTFVLQGQGAQSHPHNPGVGGTGEADAATLGTLTTASTAMSYDGWRWWRFQGSFTRFSTTGAAPSIDNIASIYETDGTP